MKLVIGVILSLVVSLAVSNPYGKFEREDDSEDVNDWLNIDDEYEEYEEDDGYYESNRGEYSIQID